MEILYTDSPVNVEVVKHLLERLFPSRKFYCWDFISPEPEGWTDEEESVVFNSFFDLEKIEFNNCISIYRFFSNGEGERALYIARHLSIAINGRTLTAYQHPDNPSDPYYSIIFKSGASYLADDSNSNLVDNSGFQIKELRPWPLPEYQFDSWGKLLH